MESQQLTIPNDFSIEDIVYLKHDVEQKPRMVITICISKDHVLYELISGTEVSNHFGFEMSKTKAIF